MSNVEFWTDAHKRKDDRWVSGSEPNLVLSRLGVDLEGVESVLEVGPGQMLLADHLTALGKRVFVHDIAPLTDPRFVSRLPLTPKVDAAIAHLVFQHVPAQDHAKLMRGVLSSLNPGGHFYFDAVTEDTRDNPPLAEEYLTGTSCPFTAWDYVTSKREAAEIRGYFFCVATA